VYGESVNKAGNDLPNSHLERGSSCMGQYEGGSANAHSLSLKPSRPGVPPLGSAGCAPRPLSVAAMRLKSLTPAAVRWPPACALRLPCPMPAFVVGRLAVPFILADRSRRQRLRAPWALAAIRPSSNL